MNTSKIFLGLGSVVLASAAFVAAKPAKKFATFTTAYTSNGAFVVQGAFQTLTNSNGHTAFFKTAASVAKTLFTAAGVGHKKAYAQ